MRWAVLALAIASPAAAQTSTESPTLDWFSGEWEGTATMFDRSAKVTLSVEPVLLNGATALTYRAQIDAAADKPGFVFEGRGTYRVSNDGRVVGQWSDSQGNFHPLAGRVTHTSLSVSWGEPRTEMGFSSYTHEPDGALTVQDSVFAKGRATIFATARYRRK